MGNIITGVPVGVAATGATGATGGGFDIIGALKSANEVMKNMKEVILIAKGQGLDQPRDIAPREIIHESPAQKCKVETGLENLYALCGNLVNAGHGEDKLTSLLDINSLTIKDAMQFIGKVIGR